MVQVAADPSVLPPPSPITSLAGVAAARRRSSSSSETTTAECGNATRSPEPQLTIRRRTRWRPSSRSRRPKTSVSKDCVAGLNITAGTLGRGAGSRRKATFAWVSKVWQQAAATPPPLIRTFSAGAMSLQCKGSRAEAWANPLRCGRGSVTISFYRAGRASERCAGRLSGVVTSGGASRVLTIGPAVLRSDWPSSLRPVDRHSSAHPARHRGPCPSCRSRRRWARTAASSGSSWCSPGQTAPGT